MPEKEIGIVEHYFGHIPAVVIRLKEPLKLGETIHIKGHTTDMTVPVSELQLEHRSVNEGHPGESVGIRINQKCREHDKVFKVV